MKSIISITIIAILVHISALAQEIDLGLLMPIDVFNAPPEFTFVPVPTPQIPPSSSQGGNTLVWIVGAGLIAGGVALAATAGEEGQVSVTTNDPFFGPITTTANVSTVNDGKRWGGVGLAVGGGALVIYGLTR